MVGGKERRVVSEMEYNGARLEKIERGDVKKGEMGGGL